MTVMREAEDEDERRGREDTGKDLGEARVQEESETPCPQAACRAFQIRIDAAPHRGDEAYAQGEVVEGVGQDDGPQGVEHPEGRFFQVEDAHEDPVEGAAVPEEDHEPEHHDDGGKHEGHGGNGLDYALAPEYVVGEQVCSGKPQQYGREGAQGRLIHGEADDPQVVGPGQNSQEKGQG